jgi:hypothetical protein
MIARNTCSPSREIAAHHHRNAKGIKLGGDSAHGDTSIGSHHMTVLQNRRQRSRCSTSFTRTQGGLRSAARACSTDPSAAAAPAWMEALFLPRPRGRMHRGKARPRLLTSSGQSLDRYHQRLRHRQAHHQGGDDGPALGAAVGAVDNLLKRQRPRALHSSLQPNLARRLGGIATLS